MKHHRKSAVAGLLLAMSWLAQPTSAQTILAPPPAIAGPDYVSTSANYTLSWGITSSDQRYYVEEQRPNGNWATIVNIGQNSQKTFNYSQPGAYRYRAKSCWLSGGALPKAKAVEPLAKAGEMVASAPTWTCGSFGPQKVVTLEQPPGAFSFSGQNFFDEDGRFYVNWNTSSGTVTYYDVDKRKDNGSWSNFYSSGTATSNYTGAKVPFSEGLYEFRGRACNHVTCSSFSTSNRKVAVVRTPNAPGAPTAPEVNTTGNFVFSWQAPTANGEPPDFYRVLHKHNEFWVDFEPLGTATGTHFNVTNHQDGPYSFKVVACKDNPLSTTPVCGADSAAVTTLIEKPPAPPQLFSVPDESNTGEYNVTWVANTGTVDFYRLEKEKHNGGSGNADNFWLPIAEPQYAANVFSHLENSRDEGRFRFRIKACNDVGGCGVPTSWQEIEVQLQIAGLVPDAGPVPLPVPASEYVGSLKESASIDGGNVSYSVDMPVPPGRNGMQPKVGLSYSSGGGNGLVGVGWSLDTGNGAVYRCPNIAAAGGENRPYLGKIEDRLCLNGQHLMLVSGTYGHAGSTYRTEITDYATVKLLDGSSMTVGSHFKVTHKSGAISRYQYAWVPQNGGFPTHWFLTQEEDLNGNQMDYVYSQGVEPVLENIFYTGFNGQQGNRNVKFVYGDRPQQERHYGYKHLGGNAYGTRRLERIETFLGSTLVHTMHLTYESSALSGRSLLTELQICDVNGDCLPKSIYAYNDQQRDMSLGTLIEGEDIQIYFVGDYDGDGKSDSVKEVTERYTDNSIYRVHRFLMLSGTPGAIPESEIGFELPGEVWASHYGPADLLLDGKADFLTVGADGKLDVVSVDYASTGNPPQINTTVVETDLLVGGIDPVFSVADFNADGRPDVLITSGSVSSRQRQVRLNCTDYSEAISTLQFCDAITVPNPDSELYTLGEIADFNEDGLPDIMFTQTDVLFISGFDLDDLVSYTQKQDENISFNELEFSPYRLPGTSRAIRLDANGDGLQDRLMLRDHASVQLQINDGTGNYIAADVSGSIGVEEHLEHGVLSVDFNGDGRDELLVPDSLVDDFCYLEEHNQDDNQAGETTITYCNESAASHPAHRFSVQKSKSRQHNRATFTYKVLSFSWSSHNAVTVHAEPSGLVLPLGQSQVCDANGDGLFDICYDIQDTFPFIMDLDTGQVFRHRGLYHQSLARGTFAWINNRAASTYGDDVLAYTKNGLGLERLWQYGPLAGTGSELCTYSEEAPFYAVDRGINAPGHYHFNSTMPVVSHYRESNGVGGMNSQCYRYEDAMYSAFGRGFQGFRAIALDTQVEGDSYSTITRTEYHDQFPLTGRVKQVEVRLSTDSADSEPLSRTTSRWNWQYDPDTRIHQVFHESNTEQTFDLETRERLGKTTVISRYYIGQDMQYGNPSRRETTRESYLEDDLAVRNRADIEYQYDYGEASGFDGWTNKLARQTVTTQPTEYLGGLAAILPDATANNTKVVTTDYQYYSDGTRRLKRETLQQGVANEESFRELGYDQYGNVTSITLGAPGEENRVVRTLFHDDGYFPFEQTNALGHRSRTWYDQRFGVVDQELSANSVRAYYRYNDMGALYGVEADGQQPVHIATQYRSGPGFPPNTVSKKITVQNGSPVVSEYLDLLGRVIHTETLAFDGNPSSKAWVYYNAHGRKVAETQPSHSSSAVDFVRYEDFDELGRYRRKLVDRTGHLFDQQWDYDYAGLSTTITLPDGVSTATRVIDANGLLLSTTDAAGSSTHYRYDSLGNKVLIQNQQGNQVRYNFDNLGRKLRVEDPDAGTAQMPAAATFYNGFGEVVSTTNANGDVLVFDYDKLGRIKHRTVNGQLEAQWTYDDQKPGTLSRVDMPELDYFQKVFYDDLVRPISTETVFNVSGADTGVRQHFHTAIAYDANHGRVKGRYFSSGEFIEYRYDKYGNLIEERDPLDGTVYYHLDSVNARGQVLSATYGNGLTLEQGYYDSTGDVETIQVNGTLGSLLDLYYEFADPFGNLTTRENRVAGATELFQYDAIQRLTQSSKSWSGGIQGQTVDYNYDAVGNILLKSDFGDVYQYGSADRGLGGNAGPHAVRRVERPDGSAIEDFQYDNAGNMIAGNNRTTVYNAYNKPLQVRENGQTTFFTYGPELELIKRKDGQRTIFYGSGGVQRVIEDGQVTERTPLTANVLVESGPEGRKVRYQHYDRLGSLVLVTDEGGQVTESHGFDAFGKALEGDWQDSGGLLHSGANGEELTERGFTGHEHLDKHKLVHMGGRVYDPLLGRFMSVDPYIQSETSTQNQNPYSYVMNNPLSMIDPSGYQYNCASNFSTGTCFSNNDDPIWAMATSISSWGRSTVGMFGRGQGGAVENSKIANSSNGKQAAKSQPASGPQFRIASVYRVNAPGGNEGSIIEEQRKARDNVEKAGNVLEQTARVLWSMLGDSAGDALKAAEANIGHALMIIDAAKVVDASLNGLPVSSGASAQEIEDARVDVAMSSLKVAVAAAAIGAPDPVTRAGLTALDFGIQIGETIDKAIGASTAIATGMYNAINYPRTTLYGIFPSLRPEPISPSTVSRERSSEIFRKSMPACRPIHSSPGPAPRIKTNEHQYIYVREVVSWD